MAKSAKDNLRGVAIEAFAELAADNGQVFRSLWFGTHQKAEECLTTLLKTRCDWRPGKGCSVAYKASVSIKDDCSSKPKAASLLDSNGSATARSAAPARPVIRTTRLGFIEQPHSSGRLEPQVRLPKTANAAHEPFLSAVVPTEFGPTRRDFVRQDWHLRQAEAQAQCRRQK